MRSYGQYCPMARAAEVLGDRWTLLIVRDLLLGVRQFNDLARGLPGISRSLLTSRLRHLEQAGLLTRQPGGARGAVEYSLTTAGRELEQVVLHLTTWGARWAFGEPDPRDLDPALLLWWMRRGVRHDRLPHRRVVVRFDFPGAHTRVLWLVLTPDEASVCLQDPGFDLALSICGDVAALYRVWQGVDSFEDALRAGTIHLDGPRSLVRAFPDWFPGSAASAIVRGQRGVS